ncbi:MAG: hypothetical protein H7236_00685, partial [Gemmatimonadaceae bacterium]|nr:hypothetical protein [Caulobacter sp.]
MARGCCDLFVGFKGPISPKDLAQETYLRLLRQVEPVQILKPKAFLLQVARNLFLTGNRQIQRQAKPDICNLG